MKSCIIWNVIDGSTYYWYNCLFRLIEALKSTHYLIYETIYAHTPEICKIKWPEMNRMAILKGNSFKMVLMSLSEKWIASRRAPWFCGLFQFVTIHFTRYDANPPFVVQFFFSAKSGLVHHHPIHIISIIAFNIIYISVVYISRHTAIWFVIDSNPFGLVISIIYSVWLVFIAYHRCVVLLFNGNQWLISYAADDK